jgi:hypothetical protein
MLSSLLGSTLKAVVLPVALLTASATSGQSKPVKSVSVKQDKSVKPAIRVELERGEAEAFRCGQDNAGRFRLIEECVSKIRDENAKQEKASVAFKLGLYLSALTEWEFSGPNQYPADNQANAISRGVSSWRAEVKSSRATLKLTEKDICSVITLKCDAVHNSLAAIK